MHDHNGYVVVVHVDLVVVVIIVDYPCIFRMCHGIKAGIGRIDPKQTRMFPFSGSCALFKGCIIVVRSAFVIFIR